MNDTAGSARQNPWQESQQGPWQEGPPEHLRDWQKNTWYGAVPNRENPFDEPEDAPELRAQRSENLNNHSGEFWGEEKEGYQFTGSSRAQRTEQTPPREKRRAGRPLFRVLMALAALGLACAILYYGVLSVREIRIIGNNRISAEEIEKISEIGRGMPMLAIRSEDVARKIEGNVNLKFRYLEKEWPGTITLAIREREACCWMTWCGIFYTMDKQRFVLFETEEQGIQPAGLVKVDGLRIRSGCMVGQTLTLDSEQQQDVFSNLFLEMKVLNCTELIEEADLSNLDSLLLTTRDGFTVALGDATNLHAKLRSMLLTRDELIRLGYEGGIINVINLENPVYSPEK